MVASSAQRRGGAVVADSMVPRPDRCRVAVAGGSWGDATVVIVVVVSVDAATVAVAAEWGGEAADSVDLVERQPDR